MTAEEQSEIERLKREIEKRDRRIADQARVIDMLMAAGRKIAEKLIGTRKGNGGGEHD